MVSILRFFVYFFIFAFSSVDVEVQAQYEPVYVSTYIDQYLSIGWMAYNAQSNRYVFRAPAGIPIGVACPSQQHDPSGALFVIRQAYQRIPIGLECNEQVQPKVFQGTDEETYGIGFPIYKDLVDPQHAARFPNVPQNQFFLAQLIVMVDLQNDQVLSVHHHIILGRFLDRELPYQQDLPPYEKNVDLYEYDIDDLYAEDNQQQLISAVYGPQVTSRFVKMQLAPEDDFFMLNDKIATRSNINTAPVWDYLIHQWNLLEIYIRRAARYFDKLSVVTGTTSGPSRDTRALFYLNPAETLPASRYIWKIVEYERELNDETLHYGVMFVMHNHPFTRNQQPLCQDVSGAWGWWFLGNYEPQSFMYACALNAVNYATFGIDTQEEREKFDLNEVYFTSNDGETVMRNIFSMLHPAQ